jgi:hypothetical protein
MENAPSAEAGHYVRATPYLTQSHPPNVHVIFEMELLDVQQ